jgi:8-oxo-dGTP pyrophosphatase MutT (NUDIX family)
MELVDMVNGEGFVLGALPRPYIHTWNILHRGSGILVSKGKDVFQAVKEGEAQLPHLYVHQRTSTKRIFPSLFDMFVGGVSCHGEDSRLTAAREVAEELGLTRALDCILGSKLDNPLSEELFQCTICTSYNRCVVSVFTYTTCNGEIITWQDEEVSWGDYVPYAVVEQAATSSIHRLVESGAWPESALDSMNNIDQSFGDEQFTLTAEITSKYLVDKWDFVPDGLLVWQAWKAYHSGVTSNTPSSSIRSSS